MVGKLLKREFYAYGRVLLPAALVVIVFFVLTSLSLLIPTDEALLMSMFLLILFYCSIFAIVVLAYVFCIKRFHDSMFSRQGYLTLALPVTPGQLLFAKAFSASVAILFSFLVLTVAGELFGAIQGTEIVFTLLGDIFELLYASDTGTIGLFIFDIFNLVCRGVAILLLLYACVAAGQLVNKHRGLVSVVSFLVVNEVYNVLSSLLSAIVWNVALTEFASDCLVDCGTLLLNLLLGVGSILFLRYILKNKVNLLA